MKLTLLLFLISDLIIIGVLLTLIIQYFLFSEYEYIWISSKILSLNKIVENKKNGQILYGFFDSYVIFLKYNYVDLLKNSTKDNCKNNFKQCGILDTYGNKLCFNESLPHFFYYFILFFLHSFLYFKHFSIIISFIFFVFFYFI